jgi:hypothetical protein
MVGCSPIANLTSPPPQRDGGVFKAEVAISRNLFADILRLIAELRPPPLTSTA